MTSKFFTQGRAIAFIEKAFGHGRQSNGGRNISVVCPICKSVKGPNYEKQKLVIKTDNFLVHCWVCGYKNRNIYRLLSKWAPEYVAEYKEAFLDAEELKTSQAEEKQKYKPVDLPTGYMLLADVYTRLHSISSYRRKYVEQALDYLKKRGICTQDELWYWKFGITTFYKEGCKDRIIIPSFNQNGILNYWTARSWRRQPKRKYKNPYCNRREVIFNEINIDWKEPLTIVEGPFDLLKCNENATCVLGSELTLEYRLLQQIVVKRTPVVLAFDPDREGQSKQFILADRMLEFDVPVKIVEYGNKEKDVGELTKSEFNELLENAKVYSANYRLRKKIISII